MCLQEASFYQLKIPWIIYLVRGKILQEPGFKDCRLVTCGLLRTRGVFLRKKRKQKMVVEEGFIFGHAFCHLRFMV